MDPRRLGAVLVAENLISDDQLEQVLRESREHGTSLIHGLVKLQIVEESPLANFLAHQFGLETADLGLVKPSAQARHLVSAEIARRFRLVPLMIDQKRFRLAVENPGDVDLVELKRAARLPADAKLEILVAPISQISAALETLYPPGARDGTARTAPAPDRGSGEIAAMTEAQVAAQEKEDAAETLDPEALMHQVGESIEVGGTTEGEEEFSVDAANQAPVKRVCNFIIYDAVRRRASDIHLNPTARGLVLRFRIDGTLQVMPSPPPAMRRGVIARYKVMANMNITERRKPQDGRIKIKVHEKTIDLRVSVIPPARP